MFIFTQSEAQVHLIFIIYLKPRLYSQSVDVVLLKSLENQKAYSLFGL